MKPKDDDSRDDRPGLSEHQPAGEAAEQQDEPETPPAEGEPGGPFGGTPNPKDPPPPVEG